MGATKRWKERGRQLGASVISALIKVFGMVFSDSVKVVGDKGIKSFRAKLA